MNLDTQLNYGDMRPPIVRRFSSFTYLNVTQFLGALNDNIYKLLLVYFFIHLEGIESSARVLATSGAIFVLPFLLFSAPSGTLADRFSKRNIIILTKILELFTMGLGLLAFINESIWGSYGVLFLMATQSAIFGPSKYGIVPEIVSSDKISKANGLMTSFTFLAIILGTFGASFILDVTNRNFILASFFCLVVSLVGLIASACIEYTPPAGSSNRFNIRVIHQIYSTLMIAYEEPSLLMAVFGSAYFLFLGAYVQLNMIPFAVQSLHLTDVQGGYLFLLTALGIGCGSILAGKISGSIAELGLVPLAGVGVAITCFLLDENSSNLMMVLVLVVIVGMFGGMYQIPLDSYIQITSPNKYRGQIVAATNFLSFIGVLIASGLIYIVSDVMHISADKGFTIVGTITLFVTVLMTFQCFDYLARLIGMILSRLHFSTEFVGQKIIPKESPAVYVCTHSEWNDTLLMLGAQRRRIRFFITNVQTQDNWWEKLYRILRVVQLPSIEPLENSIRCLTVIKKTLAKGISVCIFVETTDLKSEITKLEDSYSFQEVLEEMEVPMIPVYIEKGEKKKQPRFFTRLLQKLHVPARVTFGDEVSEILDS